MGNLISSCSCCFVRKKPTLETFKPTSLKLATDEGGNAGASVTSPSKLANASASSKRSFSDLLESCTKVGQV